MFHFRDSIIISFLTELAVPVVPYLIFVDFVISLFYFVIHFICSED